MGRRRKEKVELKRMSELEAKRIYGNLLDRVKNTHGTPAPNENRRAQ